MSTLSRSRFGDPRKGGVYDGALACGVRSDADILKESQPQLKGLKEGEVILLDLVSREESMVLCHI